MEGYGEVLDAVVLVDRTKALDMQRCGYVTFSNVHDARYVLNLKPLRIMNKQVEVTFAIEDKRTNIIGGEGKGGGKEGGKEGGESNAQRSAGSGLTTVRPEMQELLQGFDTQHPFTPVDNVSFQKFAKLLLKENDHIVASMRREIEGLKNKVQQLEEELRMNAKEGRRCDR